MILIYGFEPTALDAMCPHTSHSPEDFLADLEEQLDNGDITEDEAVQLLKDFVGI
jgi:hypothetical protein